MKHECDKTNIINEIAVRIEQHIVQQRKHEEKQEEILASMLKYHEDMRSFIGDATKMVDLFTRIATARDIFSRILFWSAKVVIAVGILIGAIYSFKKWIIK